MKKILFLLVFIFISSSSFAQIILNKRITKKGGKLAMVVSTGEIKKTEEKSIIEGFDITEIQDEYIQIQLGKRYHLLSTSKHKNIKISSHRKKKYWNVYDGDKLIPLQDEIDVLNFFNKYGFEYFKQNTTSSSGSVSVPSTSYSSITTTGGGYSLTGSSITTTGGGYSLTTNTATPSISIPFSSSSTSITLKNNNN